MKHARSDYDGIVDTSGKIPEDEPVFLLRGKDLTAPDTIRAWANFQYRTGGNREMANAAMRQADAMEEYQERTGLAHFPDAPEGALR